MAQQSIDADENGRSPAPGIVTSVVTEYNPDLPRITRDDPGLITLTWPDHGVIIDATRFDDGGRAELMVWLENEERRELLAQDSLNLLSPSAKQSFIRQLQNAVHDDSIFVPWAFMLRCVVYKVLASARQGDPVQEVYIDGKAAAPEQLIGGILYRGNQTVVFGQKGVRKSTIAYTLGICLALPWHDNPLSLAVPKESVKVLVLDWETDETTFRYYVSRLQQGMGIPTCSMFYRHCSLPLASDIELIQRYIADTGAEVLIIDSLSAAAGGERGELKGSEAALAFNAALRRLKCTSLILAQTSKASEDGNKKSIYGSTLFTYYARTVIELCAGDDMPGQDSHLGLFCRHNNLGPRMPDMGIRVEYDSEGAVKMEREPISLSEFAQKVSTSARILATLKEGAMSSKELTDRLGVSRTTVDMAVKRLRDGGKITDIGGKTWGLPAI